MCPLSAHWLPKYLNFTFSLRISTLILIINKQHGLLSKIWLSFLSLIVNKDILPFLCWEPLTFLFYLILGLICLKRVFVYMNDRIWLWPYYWVLFQFFIWFWDSFSLFRSRPNFQRVSLKRILNLAHDLLIFAQNRFVKIFVKIIVFLSLLIKLKVIDICKRHVALSNMIGEIRNILDLILSGLPLRLPHKLLLRRAMNRLTEFLLPLFIYLWEVS